MAIDWEAEVGAPTTAIFGGPATYYPADGSAPFDVTGVFDEAYRETVIIDSLSYTSDAQPVIGITDSQFGIRGYAPKQNDKVEIRDPLALAFGRTFIVKEVRPDSHGITKLMLNDWIGSR
jgi:hypothetical protein